MRIPNGILPKLAEITGIKPYNISAYINRLRTPSPQRAILLETATHEMGLSVTKEAWVFGSKNDIKSALSKKEAA